MVTYEIMYYNDIQYKIIVYSLSYANPLLNLSLIEKELCDNKIANSTIYFDMLLYYGNTKKRFFKAEYKNYKFVKDSLKNILINKKDDLRKYSVEYYKNKEKLINHSILNSVQKNAIFKGIAV